MFKASERYFDSIWEDFWRDDWHPLGLPSNKQASSRPSSRSLTQQPWRGMSVQEFPTDVKKTDTEYIVEASVPGFSKDEIHIALKKSRHIPGRNILIISGEKKEKSKTEDEKTLSFYFYHKNQ